MFKKYNKVFNQTYLDSIKTSLYTSFSNGELSNEVFKNGYGKINIPETLDLNSINNLNDIVSKDFGSNYQFTHTFSRIYFNGAELTPHIDKNDLDLTCSLTVFCNLNKPWPIHLANNKLKNNSNLDDFPLSPYSSVNIEPNEIILFKSREYPHWREPLECNLDQHSIHVFYHWKLIE